MNLMYSTSQTKVNLKNSSLNINVWWELLVERWKYKVRSIPSSSGLSNEYSNIYVICRVVEWMKCFGFIVPLSHRCVRTECERSSFFHFLFSLLQTFSEVKLFQFRKMWNEGGMQQNLLLVKIFISLKNTKIFDWELTTFVLTIFLSIQRFFLDSLILFFFKNISLYPFLRSLTLA